MTSKSVKVLIILHKYCTSRQKSVTLHSQTRRSAVRKHEKAHTMQQNFPLQSFGSVCASASKTNLMKIKALVLTLVSIFVLANLDIFAKTAETKNGNATFYGNKWHGRRTSSGSIYHKDSLTCAHRTLPFGTLLKVTNKRNGKEVIVKVTDRGPFRKDAVIDLSMAAAKTIDMVSAGIVPVDIAQVGNMPILNSSDKDNPVLPELELLDPVTGNYYTMTEWHQREQHRKEMAKTNAAKQAETFTAKAQPRYRVLDQNSTAKAGK